MVTFLRYSSISDHYCLELCTQCIDAEFVCQVRNDNDWSRILMTVPCACFEVYSNSYLEEVGKPNTSYLGQVEVSILYLEYGCCPCQYRSTRIDTIVKSTLKIWFWITPKNCTWVHAHCCKSHGYDHVYLQGYRLNFPISLDIMFWVCSMKWKK